MPHLINGTKAWSSIPFNPETIGQLYADIANKYGPQAILKPAAGRQYQKLKHPISGMDMAAFRELPSQITAISPPRLFQTKAWSYQGRFFMDCEVFWQFHYATIIKNQQYHWQMPVRILSYAYQPLIQPPQLTLF